MSNIFSAIKAAFFALLISLPSQVFAYSEKVGVMVLYETKEGRYEEFIKVVDKKAVESGCLLSREGLIVDEQGNLGLGKPDHFILFVCEASLLEKDKGKRLLGTFDKTTKSFSVYEGSMNELGKNIEGRSYLIKVSAYNDSAPAKRNSDAAMLGKDNATRAHHYKTEAFINVSASKAVKKADEVVVIYYDTPQDAAAYREQNKDHLEKIDRFNSVHLSAFSYYFVAPQP